MVALAEEEDFPNYGVAQLVDIYEILLLKGLADQLLSLAILNQVALVFEDQNTFEKLPLLIWFNILYLAEIWPFIIQN